ncbi:hypothetical protein N7488_012511 [Penicillium malachiteum]|nr:hypothetical protein N7488_012511 [Penicillium malachiteum]
MDTNDPEAKVVEQLFLDISIRRVLSNPSQLQLIEPWASLYVKAIRDRRYGDAIWARYHMFGSAQNGFIPGPGSKSIPVLEAIKQDALAYRVNDPEEYSQALSLYKTTNPSDGHPDVIDIVVNLDEEEVA